MANFQATANPDIIVAGGGIDGVTYNVLGTTDGVIVRVIQGGLNGFAQGDTYTNLTNFVLTDIANQVDRFAGSSAAENISGLAGRDIINSVGGADTVNGGAGNDFLNSGGGNDVVNGGTGRDSINAGAGNDLILAAAGDVVAGETIEGANGVDTLRLIAGGTGTEVDLSGATVLRVERVQFKADVDLKITDTQLNTFLANNGIIGSAGTGETVEITNWSFASGLADLNQAKTLLDDDVDEVRWSGENNSSITFTVEEIDGETTYILTEVDGTTTTQTFFNDSLQKIRETTDIPDQQTSVEFDPATGDEVNKTIFDTSSDGSAFIYEFLFETYDTNGVVNYTFNQLDNGKSIERAFVNGVEFLKTEVAAIGTTETFSENGSVERTVFTPSDPTGTTIIAGNSTDQTFTATDAKEQFRGLGGDDTFVFSGDIGDTTIIGFDKSGDDFLDLSAYSFNGSAIDSRDDLEAAGALSFNGASAVIDASLIGGDGTITLFNVGDANLGNDDFL